MEIFVVVVSTESDRYRSKEDPYRVVGSFLSLESAHEGIIADLGNNAHRYTKVSPTTVRGDGETYEVHLTEVEE